MFSSKGETYSFDFGNKLLLPHVYLTAKDSLSNINDVEIDPSIIANEKVFTRLSKKYSVSIQSPTNKLAEEESSLVNKEKSLKGVTKILKRIAKYNNKRNYQERISIASTIADDAEEIGVSLTIKHLLPIVNKHMVTSHNTSRQMM